MFSFKRTNPHSTRGASSGGGRLKLFCSRFPPRRNLFTLWRRRSAREREGSQATLFASQLTPCRVGGFITLFSLNYRTDSMGLHRVFDVRRSVRRSSFRDAWNVSPGIADSGSMGLPRKLCKKLFSFKHNGRCQGVAVMLSSCLTGSFINGIL